MDVTGTGRVKITIFVCREVVVSILIIGFESIIFIYKAYLSIYSNKLYYEYFHLLVLALELIYEQLFLFNLYLCRHNKCLDYLPNAFYGGFSRDFHIQIEKNIIMLFFIEQRPFLHMNI